VAVRAAAIRDIDENLMVNRFGEGGRN